MPLNKVNQPNQYQIKFPATNFPLPMPISYFALFSPIFKSSAILLFLYLSLFVRGFDPNCSSFFCVGMTKNSNTKLPCAFYFIILSTTHLNLISLYGINERRWNLQSDTTYAWVNTVRFGCFGFLWHINHCRLFNATSIFIQIISSISNNSV